MKFSKKLTKSVKTIESTLEDLQNNNLGEEEKKKLGMAEDKGQDAKKIKMALGESLIMW